MLELLGYPFFQRALIAGLLASIACGVIGSFVVVKRMSSMSGGIAHASLGGVGLGCFFGFSPFLGAIFASVVSGLIIGYVYLRHHENLDTLISMVWAIGMALGVVLISLTPGYAPDLTSYLFGSILFVPHSYLIAIAALDVFIAGSVFWCFRNLQAVAFDEDYARTRGVPVDFFFSFLVFLTSLAVVTLIKVVGVILLMALLTVPAVVSRQWVNSLEKMIFLSTAVSVFCVIGGLGLSCVLATQFALNVPSGPLVIMLCALIYFASLALISGQR